ncbi:M20 family metallo-hydrolase [Fredinandcohnia sp. FSL W7-1320]|uniref:M20 family metallo-hydrolase n=1 Tax=Fredinandcohnia sp. FSL W7-1320 TaxID=2954540 RepID=UPI0030FD97BB
MSFPKVYVENIKKNLLHIGSINSGNIGYNRLAFSNEEKKANEWLEEQLKDLNLSVYKDSIGNVHGRLGSLDKPAIAFGSHLDTVKNGGLYDGALGVIIGLECLRVLKEHGYQGVPLELISFVGEEANPLGGTFGSRATAGLIKDGDVSDVELEKFDLNMSKIKEARKSDNAYLSFLELHIEQGSVLETTNNQIGIVTAIAGISRMHVHVIGKASHSGTTPMNARNDALVSAASIIQYVSERATKQNNDIVATVGKLEVFPNSENVVPGDVQLTIEVRGSDWHEMKEFEQRLTDWMNANHRVEIAVGVQKHPNTLSENVQKAIEKTCQNSKVNYHYMVSGANHDANSLTELTEAGMIFIPSKDGLSHHPDEYSSWEDIEVGANVMLQTILELSKKVN